MKIRQAIPRHARRLVVKVGTGVLTDSQNHLAPPRIGRLVEQVATLHRLKHQVLVVSSGAIGAGMAELGLERRPKRLSELQAAAAVGQSKLMAIYDSMFAALGIQVAQVLLTHDDLKNRTRHLNARNTLNTLLARGVVPIINENDTVSVDEIKFGDNDRLGALTATLVDAELLVILSHVEGLLQDGTVVATVAEINRDIERLAGGTDRATSVGGMRSKIEAARIVARAGIPMIIASGERPGVLLDLLAGEAIGTIILPRQTRLASRKRWIAFFQRPSAVVRVDDGAKHALCHNRGSLLAKGIVAIEGPFKRRDILSIRDGDNGEFARGLARVSVGEARTTAGVVVRRDDLVIL